MLTLGEQSPINLGGTDWQDKIEELFYCNGSKEDQAD